MCALLSFSYLSLKDQKIWQKNIEKVVALTTAALCTSLQEVRLQTKASSAHGLSVVSAVVKLAEIISQVPYTSALGKQVKEKEL